MHGKEIFNPLIDLDFLKQKTMLLCGLPAIKDGGDWIIYSPYAQKVVKCSGDFIRSRGIEKYLQTAGVLGVPKNKSCQSSEEKTLSLIVTSTCNLRCKYCFTKGGDTVNSMTSSMAQGLIDNILIGDCKALRLTFFGGEPTLNFPVVQSATRYAQKKASKAYFHISTNGIASRKKFDFLIENGFTINVSMDGIPKNQDALRPFPDGSGSALRVEETIRYLVRREAKLKIRITITEDTVDTMPECISYLSELGVRYVHFEPANLSGRALEENIIQPQAEEFVRYFVGALDVALEKGLRIINSAYMNILEPTIHYCGAAAGDKFIIGPSGDISLCFEVQDSCHSQSASFLIGRVAPDGTVRKELRNPRLPFEYSVEVLEECKNCFAKYVCSGGCPVRNMNATGRFLEVNKYYCKIKKMLLHEIMCRISRKAGFHERGVGDAKYRK